MNNGNCLGRERKLSELREKCMHIKSTNEEMEKRLVDTFSQLHEARRELLRREEEEESMVHF